MRAINSAVALSRELNKKIKIVWVKDSGLNAKFSDIFQFPDDKNIEICQPLFSIYNLRFTMRYPFYMNTIRYLLRINYDKVLILNQLELEKLNPESLHKYHKIFMTSYSSGFYDSEFDSSLFRPVEKLMNEIVDISQKFIQPTYGIHIRRGDNKESCLNSPIELFEKKINEILKVENDAQFYLATDSIEERTRLIKKYGNRIISKFINTNRNRLEGIESAVIDLFLLSRTKMIIGSYWSSFSEVAAMIGNVPLIQIKKD